MFMFMFILYNRGTTATTSDKLTTYQSCTDFRRSIADATLRLTISPTTQHKPFMVLTNLRQKTNHGETTVRRTSLV